MKKTFSYRTRNDICCKEIIIVIDNNDLIDISFDGGCKGNLKALTNIFVKDKWNIDKIIQYFENLKCGNKESSCMQELSNALKIIKGIENI
jgi:uncharacterized protein (TIGR03905 family)